MTRSEYLELQGHKNEVNPHEEHDELHTFGALSDYLAAI